MFKVEKRNIESTTPVEIETRDFETTTFADLVNRRFRRANPIRRCVPSVTDGYFRSGTAWNTIC